MMTITQAERLVRKIAEVAGQPASDTQTAKLAQEYADLCRAANRRLEQCAIMIEAGQFLQALQLAETLPPLLDLITVLGFRQAAEWRSYCQTHQLPWSEPFYDKYVRLLNSTYGKGIASDHPFYRDYRRAVMKNDDEHALSILRVIARMNPSDQNTKDELKRLEEKLLRGKLEKLRQVVATGDSPAMEAELARIESSGVPIPSTHPVWQQAQVARCQDLLRRADQLRHQDAWQDAEVLVEEIQKLATQYNVQLPAADADAWTSLEEWTTGKRSAYADDQDFHRALSSLEYEVQTIETRRANANRLSALDAKNSFNSLAAKWSEAERFNRPLGEKLIGRCEQCRLWLQNCMNAAGRRHRIATIAVSLLVFAAVAATIPFVLNWARERDLLLRLNMLESTRRVSETESLISHVSARIKAKAAVPEAINKAQSFISHEKELKRVFDETVKGLQQSATGNFKTGIEQIGPRRAHAERALAQLAPEFQLPGRSALDVWDVKWQPVRQATLSAQLDHAEQAAAGLNGTNGFDEVHAAVVRMQSMLADMDQLTNEPPALDRNLDARLRQLNAKIALWTGQADQWDKAQSALANAQSLDQYLDRLDPLVQSPFATAAQRDGVVEIDRLKINRETLLGQLLLPNDPTIWDSLTNVAEWRTTLMPEQPTAPEKDLYLKLRDDKNMQSVFVYQLVTNARPNNPFHNHPIFVQGSIERDRGGAMAGLVFDPTETRDTLRFVAKRYSDWDWNYGQIKNLFRTEECESFERIGLGELINPNTGNYQKPLLQLFDQLDQETNASALFRAFVTLKLFAVAELRPEDWGMQWSSAAGSLVQRLTDLGARDLKSGDWMVPSQSAKYEAPLQTCFARLHGLSMEKQARLLQQLARETCQTDFSYAGFIDINGHPVLRQISPPVSEYWGWGSGSRSAVLLLRKSGAGTTFEQLAEPMPYTPLFIFNGDRQRLLLDTGRSLSYPASQMAGNLPPFFTGLSYE
jgi:hypothetical protein